MDDIDYVYRVERWQSSSEWMNEAISIDCLLDAGRTDNVLDVGTNTGAMLRVITRFRSLWPRIVAGVEPNDAARRISYKSDLIFGSLSEAKMFKKEGWDRILMSHVLGHADRPSEMLTAVSMMMKLGAKLVVVVPNPYYERMMIPANVFTGYKSDPTLKHLLSIKQIESMSPENTFKWEWFYLGETPPWIPFKTPEWTRQRLVGRATLIKKP